MLIQKFRAEFSPKITDNYSDYKQFQFWMDFFVETTKFDEDNTETRFPILIYEPNKVKTSVLFNEPKQPYIHLL